MSSDECEAESKIKSHFGTKCFSERVPCSSVMEDPACVLLGAECHGGVRGDALEVFVFREGLESVTG